MWSARVSSRSQVEREIAIRVAGVRIGCQAGHRMDPPHVGGRPQDFDRVRLSGDELRYRDVEIGRKAPDQPAQVWSPEEEGRISGQLETLSGFPPYELVRAVADRLPSERRGLPRRARHRAQEMRGQHAHVIDRIVEHFGVGTAEPKYG